MLLSHQQVISVPITILQITTYFSFEAIFWTSMNQSQYKFVFVQSCTQMRLFFFTFLFIGAFLFICMSQLVNILLEELYNEIWNRGHRDEKTERDSSILKNQMLDEWRDKYQLICELVDALNRCFGLIIVVLLAFSFIWMVNSSYYCVIGFRSFNKANVRSTLVNLGFEVVGFICFTYIAYIPHTIKQKVHYYIATIFNI